MKAKLSSDPPNALVWISLADTAAGLGGVVTARTAGGRARVVGLSLGGYVGLHLAASAAAWVTGATRSGVSPGASGSPCPVLAVAGGNEHELTRRSVADHRRRIPTCARAVGRRRRARVERRGPGVFSAMIRFHVLDGELPADLEPVVPS